MPKKNNYYNILIKQRLKALKEYLYLLQQNKLTFAALIIILFLIIIAIIAPIIVPFPSHIYGAVNPQDKLLSPSWTYLFVLMKWEETSLVEYCMVSEYPY